MSEQLPGPHPGDIWLVDCDPQVGREQGGIRPALIVSNEYFNQLPNDLFVVLPITTRNRGVRLHVPIAAPEGGLKRPSVIMCDQVKAASVDRLLEQWGTVDEETLDRVVQILNLMFERDDNRANVEVSPGEGDAAGRRVLDELTRESRELGLT